jgi:hypothetical protein
MEFGKQRLEVKKVNLLNIMKLFETLKEELTGNAVPS